MKSTAERPYANPEAAARKLIEIAKSVEVMQDGRIYVELINGPFLYESDGSPSEYLAGLHFALDRRWLEIHRSGAYVRVTQAGADLFA